ncbi:MAG: hypothetical protein WC467_04455 [Patescibacteria group bacterium]
MNNLFLHFKKQSGKLALIAVFVFYLAITLYGAIIHQPWRDEAQSWLIARDLNPIGIIKQLPYEGTPPLWHFILYPFAASGAPYASEFILNYIFTALAIFLLLFYSPLPKSVKLILPFSYYFLFEYSVVARNYGLMILTLFLIALLYPSRFRRPLIYALAILAFTWSGIQALALSALLLLYFVIESLQNKHEERKYLFSIILMLLSQVAVIFMLLPYPDQIYDGLHFNGLSSLVRALSAALLAFFDNSYISPAYFWILASGWIFLGFTLLKTRRAQLLFFVSSAWLSFIILFKNSGSPRHYGLFLIVFLFAFWLDFYYRPVKESISLGKGSSVRKLINFSALVFFLTCLIGSAAYGIYYYYENQKTNYSGAKEMANYLIANNLTNEEIVSYPAIAGSALLPYLPGKSFYELERGEKGTYMTWDVLAKYTPLLPYPLIKNKMEQFYAQPENKVSSVLILSTWPLGQYDHSLLFLKENTKPSLTDEYFYLYRYKLPQ